MIKTLRTKLLIGLLPLLALMVGLGLWAVFMFLELGGNIDVILRENYKSILAAEGMKESIERMDSSLLFAIGGEEKQARDQYAQYRPEFAKHLKIELGNVTLPGEGAMADDLTNLSGNYYTLTDQFFAIESSQKGDRTQLYFLQLQPLFNQIKNRADDVLNLNQRNMEFEDQRARQAAQTSVRLMIVALVTAAVLASVIAIVLSRSILVPVRAVTESVRAMACGHYDQLVPINSHDEIGELAEAFNSMARTIRAFQQAGTAKLLRAQATAQATIDSFPDPVILLDPTGAVERANPAAVRILGVSTQGGTTPWSPPASVRPALSEVLSGLPDHLPNTLEHAIALRDQGQERYFLPRVLAIRDTSEGLLGAALVLSDVTKFRLVDQLKSDMVSTVSHELKTPLTSMQMAVHLLLEEAVGPLTAKQVELLLAARQESDRLLAMVNDLLDLTRIEQGRVRLELAPVPPGDLIRETIERFETRSTSLGIRLVSRVDPDLPRVEVDKERMEHVFDNLVNNALAHTRRGGTLTLSGASPDHSAVRFEVTDTGEGISPEHLPQIFEKFYRVPGITHTAGAGLGLAIAREIVLAHDGRIEAASELGQGSTFTITLPSESRIGADPW